MLKSLSVVIIIFFFFLMSFKLSQTSPYPVMRVDKQLTKISFPPEFFKALSLGQTRLISSLLWIDVLMDADASHYKFDDLNSWMYLRFMTIAKLDPYFYENYLYGGIFLSIIKDDDLGAEEIYNLGLKHFPNDIELLKNAAFHFRFELQDYSRAQELYQKLNEHPSTPPYLKSLLARLKSHHNDHEGALEILWDIHEKAADGSRLKEKVFESIYALKAEIDLKCLNSATPASPCSKQDLSGQPYIQDEKGIFQAPKDFKPFGLGRK